MSLKPSLKWCMWNGCPFAASIMFHVSNGVDLFWKGKGLCKWTKRHALVRWRNQHSQQDWHVLNRLKLTLHTSYSLEKKVCRLARQNTSRYMSSDTVNHSAAVHKQSQFDFMSSHCDLNPENTESGFVCFFLHCFLISDWQSGSWWCITTASLITNSSAVQKISSGGTFIEMLNLCCDPDNEDGNPIFSHSGYEDLTQN